MKAFKLVKRNSYVVAKRIPTINEATLIINTYILAIDVDLNINVEITSFVPFFTVHRQYI